MEAIRGLRMAGMGRPGNAGDYLAPPAVAELMYGEATRARTAASRIVIAPAADAR